MRIERKAPTDRGRRAVHAMTVDLEDWAHGLLHGDTPITDRVVRNVDRVLDLLDRYRIRATFFALGKVCECHPQILPTVIRRGHEIGCHGYGHEPVFHLTPELFRDDVRRCMDIIGEQTNQKPIGYRAPAFSITRRSLWAIPILEELGFKYSSSVFPWAGPRYGMPESPRGVFCWGDESLGQTHPARDCRLIEFPMTTLEVAGRRVPVCGGGYLRLFPARVAAWAIRQMQRIHQPAVVYLHPYELDAAEVSEMVRAGLPISQGTAMMQSMFRSRVSSRLRYLFERFQFAPMREVLGL